MRGDGDRVNYSVNDIHLSDVSKYSYNNLFISANLFKVFKPTSSAQIKAKNTQIARLYMSRI